MKGVQKIKMSLQEVLKTQNVLKKKFARRHGGAASHLERLLRRWTVTATRRFVPQSRCSGLFCCPLQTGDDFQTPVPSLIQLLPFQCFHQWKSRASSLALPQALVRYKRLLEFCWVRQVSFQASDGDEKPSGGLHHDLQIRLFPNKFTNRWWSRCLCLPVDGQLSRPALVFLCPCFRAGILQERGHHLRRRLPRLHLVFDRMATWWHHGQEITLFT